MNILYTRPSLRQIDLQSIQIDLLCMEPGSYPVATYTIPGKEASSGSIVVLVTTNNRLQRIGFITKFIA